jgi:hypothetical protein
MPAPRPSSAPAPGVTLTPMMPAWIEALKAKMLALSIWTSKERTASMEVTIDDEIHPLRARPQ